MINIKIGKKLYDLRKSRNYSQEQVADSLTMSYSAYSRMENGRCNTWVKKLDDICKFYEIEPEYLLKEDKTTNNIIEPTNCNIGFEKVVVNNNFPEGILENMLKRIELLEQKLGSGGG